MDVHHINANDAGHTAPLLYPYTLIIFKLSLAFVFAVCVFACPLSLVHQKGKKKNEGAPARSQVITACRH